MSFNNMRKQFAQEWKTADVHEWSQALSVTILDEFPDLPAKINELEPNFPAAKAKISQQLFPHDVYVASFLRMCESRQNMKDNDVLGISCGGCLVMLYCLVAHYKFDPSLVAIFHDTMYDMGTTCLQGYTHRMLSVIIALTRDMQASRAGIMRNASDLCSSSSSTDDCSVCTPMVTHMTKPEEKGISDAATRRATTVSVPMASQQTTTFVPVQLTKSQMEQQQIQLRSLAEAQKRQASMQQQQRQQQQETTRHVVASVMHGTQIDVAPYQAQPGVRLASSSVVQPNQDGTLFSGEFI